MTHEEQAEFPGLPAAYLVPGTDIAQRFLASAYDSVEDLLAWHKSASDLAQEDGAEDRELGARTHESAQDMLRSMIVFAGAGIDAVVKQLIRETLDAVVSRSDVASQKFSEFVEKRLDLSAGANAKYLTRYLLSTNPRQALVDEYVQYLTGSSLQSVAQLDVALSALGIVDRDLRRRCKDLRPLFEARNEIVHELDLVDVHAPGDRHRRERKTVDAIGLAHVGLEVSQLIINAVGAIIETEAN